jgi:hypothetical protein
VEKWVGGYVGGGVVCGGAAVIRNNSLYSSRRIRKGKRCCKIICFNFLIPSCRAFFAFEFKLLFFSLKLTHYELASPTYELQTYRYESNRKFASWT